MTNNDELANARLAAANQWFRDEIQRLRLTDAEQVAIEQACDEGRWYPADYHHIHTLRGLLARVRS